MATTIGLELSLAPSTSAFDSPPSALMNSYDSGVDSSSREIPPPNPHFVFPAQAPPSSASTTFTRSIGRRPMSAIESPTHSFGLSSENADRAGRPALPSFSFNPGASLSPDSRANFISSPPVSPNSPRGLGSQNRPAGHGHRRGGSEFVGGRLREGSSIAVMSTSPTKPENGNENPSAQPSRRRGHRRGVSGAISTNDLPILQPPNFNPSARGNSAPNSPTMFQHKDDTTIASQQDLPPPALSLPEPVETCPETLEPPRLNQDLLTVQESPKAPKTGPRARVGFSDTLEFVPRPRPLSMISTDTSSTVTARPGHSVSGSLSSVVSGMSPAGHEGPRPICRSPTKEMSDSRPSTAGAILENIPDINSSTSPKRRNSIPTLSLMPDPEKVGSAEPSPTKPKRWSFFVRETASPSKARPQSFCALEDTRKAISSSPLQFRFDPSNGDDEGVDKKKKKSKKGKKKKKKVKGWAGSILPRKPKDHGKNTTSGYLSPSTEPPRRHSFGNEDMYPEPELLMPTPTVTITASPDPPPLENLWKRYDDEPSVSMIDLDAALGPFNTPLPHNPEWEAAQRAAGNNRRRLHSAQGMKGFSGPGMHYHRRSESAPDLPPFDTGRAGIHRFNSSSTMADVFEEDEEDDDDESKSDPTDSSDQNDSDSEATPSAVQGKDPMLYISDRLSVHSAELVRRKGSDPSEEPPFSNTVRTERSRSSLHESIIPEEPCGIIFRTHNVFGERSDQSGSATPSPKRFASRDLAPVDVGPLHLPSSQAPISPYAASQSSSFPSPRSPMSVDAQRISTAPSSVADENNFQSLLMGEPGPEVRISVDYDIPSLTSSTSTMTRESFVPGPRLSQPNIPGQRPVSVSSAAFGRRRSSLASLSRLISSSHGERSKLSVEVTLDNDAENKKSKSKTKRLGRMMQFWKPHNKGDAKGDAKGGVPN